MSHYRYKSVHTTGDQQSTSFEENPEIVLRISSSSSEDEAITNRLNIKPPRLQEYDDTSNTRSHHRRSVKEHKKRKHHGSREKHHRRKYLKYTDDNELRHEERGKYYKKRPYDEGNSINIEHASKQTGSKHKRDVSRSCRHTDLRKEENYEMSDRVKKYDINKPYPISLDNSNEQCYREDFIETETNDNVRKYKHKKCKEKDIPKSDTDERLQIPSDEEVVIIEQDIYKQRSEREESHSEVEESNINYDHIDTDTVSICSDDNKEINTEKDINSYTDSDQLENDKSTRNKTDDNTIQESDEDLLPYYPAIQGCRSVNEFQLLNHVEEGTYGVVYRAIDKRIKETVALKRLKMEKEKEGFPITSLREINTLLKGQHPNIVTVREIVVGNNMDKIYIVMDFVEYDLKSFMETMRQKKQIFTAGKVKCLLKQLLCAVAYLHDNWILHRDLKPSNLLLSRNGILKVGDFGLAREYGSPLKAYTPVVVTLWYRAPELLLCTKEYSTPIDVWSVGCIFGELQLMNPVFPGKSEVDELNKIFRLLGTPDETIWPGFNKLPAVQHMKFIQYFNSSLKSRFQKLSVQGYTLLQRFLTYDPVQRITAEKALQDAYFCETPLPVEPSQLLLQSAENDLDTNANVESIAEEYDRLLEATKDKDDTGLPKDLGFRLKF